MSGASAIRHLGSSGPPQRDKLLWGLAGQVGKETRMTVMTEADGCL